MRLTVTAGETTVDIQLDREDLETLNAAEQTALRLLIAPVATPAKTEDEQPFGYSVIADVERAPEPELSDSED